MSTMDMLIMAFGRDEPFTMGDDVCYFNKTTHEVEWAGDDISVPETQFLENPDWIKVPGTSHGEWHEVFKEWLEEVGAGHFYTKSIGLTLKHLDEVDEKLRQSWYDKKWNHTELKAEKWLSKYQ